MGAPLPSRNRSVAGILSREGEGIKNGLFGTFSPIDVAELQFAYIVQLAENGRCGACKEVSPVSRWAYTL